MTPVSPTTPPAPAADTSPAAVAREPRLRGEWQVLRELLPFLRPFTGRIVLALLLVVAGKLVGLAVPLVLKQLVDRLDARETVLLLPVALLLAYGASRIAVTLFTELRQVVFARVMARAARHLTLQVFRHLHALSLRFHLSRRTGGVARDVERGATAVSDLLDWTLYTIIPTLFEVALVCGVLAWHYGWSFALITLATLAGYIVFTFAVTDWRNRYYRAAVEADTRATSARWMRC